MKKLTKDEVIKGVRAALDEARNQRMMTQQAQNNGQSVLDKLLSARRDMMPLPQEAAVPANDIPQGGL